MDFLSTAGISQREKDVCEYEIFLERPSAARAAEIQNEAYRISEPWAKDYIWQDQPFTLTVNEDHSLSGSTSFGDCIEDEWFIVWILVELSRQHADIYVHISDTDGEFLLIESAMHLPRWLDPDIATYRAWITHGELVIIEPCTAEIAAKQCPDLSLEQALTHLRSQGSVLSDPKIQADALSRTRSYPQRTRTEMHKAICTLPRTIATLLRRQRTLISRASIEFYQRDPSQVQRFNAGPIKWSLEDLQDQVTVPVTFSRTLYAQVKGARYSMPAWYPASAKSIAGNRSADRIQELERIVLGSKLLCGFSLLVLADPVMEARITEILQAGLISDAELLEWSKEVADSDDYLDVNYSELDQVLADRQQSSEREGAAKGATNDDDNAKPEEMIQKMVEQMSKFMAGDGNFEGAEFSDDNDDDVEDSQDGASEAELEDDEAEAGFGDDLDFMSFLRSSVGKSKDSLSVLRERQMAQQAESDSSDEGEDDEDDEDDPGDLQSYMAEMDHELSSQHGLGATTKIGKKGQPAESEDKTAETSMDDELNIDYAMVKNMLDSLNSEGGMGGPAAALFGRLGINLPRDDDDDDSQSRTSDVGNASLSLQDTLD